MSSASISTTTNDNDKKTRVLKVDSSSINFEEDLVQVSDPESLRNLQEASAILQNTCDPVAFPTETVYGLGASCLSTQAVKNIYTAKNRPADNPLIIHISSEAQLQRKLNSQIPEIYRPLINTFWPGPLTILLPVPSPSPISTACTVGQSTFAVRMPVHPVARALIALADLPLAAPSANTSTRPSPTLAEHVYTDLQGRIPLILDGGACDVGVESTVIDGLSNPPILLRPGGVSAEQIRSVGGHKWADMIIAKGALKDNEVARTPGMKYRHYSPTTPVVLFVGCGDGSSSVKEYLDNNSENSSKDHDFKVALLTSFHFDNNTLRDKLSKYPVDIMSLGSSAREISFNLFAYLRDLDTKNYTQILIEGIEETEEGLAVMNRLRKAASVTIVPN